MRSQHGGPFELLTITFHNIEINDNCSYHSCCLIIDIIVCKDRKICTCGCHVFRDNILYYVNPFYECNHLCYKKDQNMLTTCNFNLQYFISHDFITTKQLIEYNLIDHLWEITKRKYSTCDNSFLSPLLFNAVKGRVGIIFNDLIPLYWCACSKLVHWLPTSYGICCVL